MANNNNNARDTKAADHRGLAAKVKAVIAMRPTVISAKLLRTLIGNVKLRTLPEVAEAFGRSPNTVNQTWRQGGMPGGSGRYDAAEILAWLLQRDAEIADRTRRNTASSSDSDRELERRQLEAETRKLELQAEKLEREAQIAMGNLIHRDAALTPVKTAAALLTERLMKLPAEFEPSFPISIAPDLVATFERAIRRELTAFSETSAQAILQSKGATNGQR